MSDTLSEQKVCFVCLIRPYIRLGIAFGIIGHSCSCPHSDKSAKTASFHRSYTAMCIAVLIIILNVTIISYNTWFLLWRDTKWYRLGGLIFEISSGILQIIRFFSRNASIQEYTGIMAIIEHCEMYGVSRIFNQNDIDDFKLQTVFILTVWTATATSYLTCNFIFITDLHFWVIFNIALKTIDCLIAGITCIIITAHIKVYVKIMNACYMQIKKCLNERIEDQTAPSIADVPQKPNRTGVVQNRAKSRNITKTYRTTKSIAKGTILNRLSKLRNRTIFRCSVEPQKCTFTRSAEDQRRAKFKTILKSTLNTVSTPARQTENDNVNWHARVKTRNAPTQDSTEEHKRKYKKFKISTLTQLQKLQRLYIATMTNIEQMNDVLNPIGLTAVVCDCAIVIIGYYFMIKYWMNGERPEGPVVILYIDTGIALVLSVWILLILNHAYSPGNDILKFLDNFPVNRLTLVEISQIEALNDTVRIIKPTITASGIFDFHLDIFGSITAVVVSYVLLAVQFHGAWQKE